MSFNDSPSSFVDKLERQLANCLPADKNIVRRKKNGDIIYETVRTHYAPTSETPEPSPSEPNPNNLPNTLPQTPMIQKNGNLIADSQAQSTSPDAQLVASEPATAVALAIDAPTLAAADQSPSNSAITCHEAENPGNQQSDPLTELLHRALAATKTRRGHPPAFDGHSRGQLVALLSVGMSMRQAASVLGVSHTTVQNTLKADPTLSEQITAARFQAQLQPLACVIREARRSWKAATWLLKYLDTKIATHEETPDERRDRQQRETDEFHAHIRRRH